MLARGFRPGEANSAERFAAELQEQTALLRDIFGNPFCPVSAAPSWLAWGGGTVVRMAEAIYEERRFEDLPYLGDALEGAGCDNQDLLAHCRTPETHVRGCWVVDLVLDRA